MRAFSVLPGWADCALSTAGNSPMHFGDVDNAVHMTVYCKKLPCDLKKKKKKELERSWKASGETPNSCMGVFTINFTLFEILYSKLFADNERTYMAASAAW